MMGLGLALVARVFMLFLLLALSNLTDPIFLKLSVRDIMLVTGGLFLLWKAVHEIHETVELKDEAEANQAVNVANGFVSIIIQIVLLDIVFSIDSVITAIGLRAHK